jgi:hypothetical protein
MDFISNIYDSPVASPLVLTGAQNSSASLKRQICVNECLFDDVLQDCLEIFDELKGDSDQSVSVSQTEKPSKRIRLSLTEKKEHVDRFLWYCDTNETNKLTDVTQLMSEFVADNNSCGMYYKLNSRCLKRWLAAYNRGEFDGRNGGFKKAESKIVHRCISVKHIDKFLRERDPYHAAYNEVSKSPSLPEEYGVIARKFTPSGSFLGYYKGTILHGQRNDTRNHDYTFAIGRNKFVDASNVLSCFARYYNCATDHADQNVGVELLTDWKNPQKAICFIANRDIAQGEEFLVSYGPDYWTSLADNLPQKSRLMKVCKKLSDRQGYSLFSPLYSVEAPSLAAAFLDDVSESEDEEDASDSDFTL